MCRKTHTNCCRFYSADLTPVLKDSMESDKYPYSFTLLSQGVLLYSQLIVSLLGIMPVNSLYYGVLHGYMLYKDFCNVQFFWPIFHSIQCQNVSGSDILCSFCKPFCPLLTIGTCHVSIPFQILPLLSDCHFMLIWYKNVKNKNFIYLYRAIYTIILQMFLYTE